MLLDSYREMQSWLSGKKPSALGFIHYRAAVSDTLDKKQIYCSDCHFYRISVKRGGRGTAYGTICLAATVKQEQRLGVQWKGVYRPKVRYVYEDAWRKNLSNNCPDFRHKRILDTIYSVLFCFFR